MTANPDGRSADAWRSDIAADWLQRLPDARMSEEDLQSWLQWYGSSEANREAFDKTQQFYMRLRGMSPRQRTLLLALATEARTSAPKSRWSRKWLSAAASVVLGALALGLWLAAGKSSLQNSTYAAPIDRHRTVLLADGSQMVLNARAVANVSYARTSRTLEVMQGAAYFQVKRDARRPFVVRAGGVSVTALGTAFSVTREADRLSITVTEGSVEVLRDADSVPGSSLQRTRVRMMTGERTQIRVGHAPLAERAHDSVKLAGEWRNGSIQFFNTPLSSVIEAVNAHATRPILIDDPRVQELNYSGTVMRERIEEWLMALPHIYPVRCVPLSDGAITLVLRSNG